MLEEITHQLASGFACQAILCYGSYAQGLEDEKSDIDLFLFPNRLTAEALSIFYNCAHVINIEFYMSTHYNLFHYFTIVNYEHNTWIRSPNSEYLRNIH